MLMSLKTPACYVLPRHLDRLSRRYPYIATRVCKNLNKVLATKLYNTPHELT